jgi:hypothetical protein
LKNAKDVSAVKAVSQNLMQENLIITDGVHGILSEYDVRVQINALGRTLIENSMDDRGQLIMRIQQLLEQLCVNIPFLGPSSSRRPQAF